MSWTEKIAQYRIKREERVNNEGFRIQQRTNLEQLQRMKYDYKRMERYYKKYEKRILPELNMLRIFGANKSLEEIGSEFWKKNYQVIQTPDSLSNYMEQGNIENASYTLKPANDETKTDNDLPDFLSITWVKDNDHPIIAYRINGNLTNVDFSFNYQGDRMKSEWLTEELTKYCDKYIKEKPNGN